MAPPANPDATTGTAGTGMRNENMGTYTSPNPNPTGAAPSVQPGMEGDKAYRSPAGMPGSSNSTSDSPSSSGGSSQNNNGQPAQSPPPQ
jgi:hypothetical protein